jgi:D-sedoheptulose 7-phosphate isomerase
MNPIIKTSIDKHAETLETLRHSCQVIDDIALMFITSLKNNGKIIFMGNGGSAADSQHLAAELIGRFKKNRASLPAIALSTNTSTITAIGNDFGFEQIFSRQVEALASDLDILVGISTSGNSNNVINAIKTAKQSNVKTVGFLGHGGGKLKKLVDTSLIINSFDTPRIQEMHLLSGHIICEIVEQYFTEKNG